MTQEVLKLAEDYAKNRANYHIESLYGTNESYTATIKKAMLEAHQALKEALAQTQEPVAYYHPHKGFYFAKPTSVSAPITVDVEPLALYTTPPQRTWVALTDEEVELYWDWEDFQCGCGPSTLFAMVRDIEARLKDRNI